MSPTPNPFQSITHSPNLQPPTRHAWMDRALCAEVGTDLFYPDGPSMTHAKATETAKAVCAVCPVQSECLEHALTHDERYGVWGGLTERERREVKRERRMA